MRAHNHTAFDVRPWRFTSVISAEDFPNPYLPLPSEQVLETLLQKARCVGPSNDVSGGSLAQDGSHMCEKGDQPTRSRPSSPLHMSYVDVELFCQIRSWLILHQPPAQGLALREDLDVQIARVTDSIHLLASALILHRCWLHLVEEDTSRIRNIVSDVILAIQATLPGLIRDVSQDNDMCNDADGEPYQKKRRRRRKLVEPSLEWLEPHLVDWSLRRAMDQFLFPAKDRVRQMTKSESYNRYQHFVQTFRRFSRNEKRPVNTDDESKTREITEKKMVLSLLHQLKEVRLVVRQSIEAYNDFRSIFLAVLDKPGVLSSSPFRQGIDLDFTDIAENSTSAALVLNASSNHMYLQQKRWLDLGWKLSLHARLTLSPPSLHTVMHNDHCRCHAMFCSAASIACIEALLLDGFGKRNSEEPVQQKHHSSEGKSDDLMMSAAKYWPDSVWDMILTVVNAVESTDDSQSSLEEEVPTGRITKRQVQIAAGTLLQSILSKLEYSEKSPPVDETAQLQALDDSSKKDIVSSFASVVSALSDHSISKALTISYYHFIDQSAIPIDCFTDSLGSIDADFSKSGEPADVQRVANPLIVPTSLFSDKVSQAAAVLQTIEDMERHTLQCDATPIVITDDMELTEWAISTSFVKDVHPSKHLLALLDEYTRNHIGVKRHWEDVVYPIITRTLQRMSNEYDKKENTEDAPVTLMTKRSSSGYVRMRSKITADMQLCKALVALYYHALEAILYSDKVQSTNDEKSTMKKNVLLESFHQSLLACCCLCVTKANAFAQRLRVSSFMKQLTLTSILLITGSGPYEFLKVSSRFLRSLAVTSVARGKLTSPLIFPLPSLLRNDIEQVEVNIIDSLLWLRNKTLPSGTSFTDRILEYQQTMAIQGPTDARPCLWPPNVLAPTLQEELEDAGVTTYIARTYPTPEHPEYDNLYDLSRVITKLLLLARNRLVALCHRLQVHAQGPVFTQVWVTFRHLLRCHVDLFFDRHIDQWILCTLYGVSRSVKYQPELKFAKIIEAYVAIREQELGPIMCQRIVRHIRITAPTATDEGMGNIISLYNKVFVPRMKDYLLNSESLRRCTITLASSQQK